MKLYSAKQAKEMNKIASCIESEGRELLSALKTETSEEIKKYITTFCELVKAHCDTLQKVSEENQ